MKKRILFVLMALVLVASMFAGCSAAKYKDGVYFAKGEFSNDWRDFVVVTVEKGKITDAYWGGTNTVPQGDKRVISENGGYDMVTYGGAKSQWFEQAKACEDWLLKNQDPAKFDSLYSDAEGHTTALTTDTGASVSIHVKGFFALAHQRYQRQRQCSQAPGNGLFGGQIQISCVRQRHRAPVDMAQRGF